MRCSDVELGAGNLLLGAGAGAEVHRSVFVRTEDIAKPALALLREAKRARELP